MSYTSKTLILCAGLALVACTNADRFEGQTTGGAGAGMAGGAGMSGSPQDPTSQAYFSKPSVTAFCSPSISRR